MSDLTIRLDKLTKIARNLRRNVPDVESLRRILSARADEAFLVNRRIYIWVAGDKTPDDGVSSIRPAGTPESIPGRFRRTAPVVG